MKIISKDEAVKSGQTAYFTGVPCIRGHIDLRGIANGSCHQCNRDAQKKHRAKNLEAQREKSRKWYANNKERAKLWKREWVKNNPEVYRARRKRYRSQIDVRAREMFAASQWSARQKNIPHDLDIEWIGERIRRGKCELTDLPFNLEPLDGGLQNPYTASLDRIVPSLGYVKSNVRMILWALNAAFNSYGEEVYAEIAKVYLSRRGDKGGLT